MILSDVCEFIVDCPHSTAPDEGKGYPLIRTPNVGKGRLDLNGVHRVSESVYKQRIQRGAPRANDLIFAREAPAGNVALVQENQTVCLGQRTVLIRPNVQKVNPQYLVYYLLSPKPQYELLGTANGATVAHINLPAIRNLKIELPEKSVQDKIGTILVTYDDLIENNQRQSKLLEEAAQRLYKEWFVDLRFPGHENTKIVDGVPEGWSRTNINEILTFHRGYDLTKNEMKAGRYPVVGSTTVIGYHNEFKIKGPGIVTGRSGSLGKYQFIWDNFWPHNTSLYISDYKDHNIFFVYSLLQTVDFASLNNGGAIPTLNRNVLSNIEVIEPTDELQEMFAKIAEPQYQKIKNLEKQNDKLKTARDLLLPKFMSGEVEV